MVCARDTLQGPTLFKFFRNDEKRVSELTKFADDTTHLQVVKSRPDGANIKKALMTLKHWVLGW